MTFGSLFAGIGGMDLGLERAGMVCKWQVEIDDYATRVLEKHWPNVRRWRDVRDFPPSDPDEWRVDLIAGGFPCQDTSQAGRGIGLDGARSGLWHQFARVICALRPRLVLVENVPGLRFRGLARVLSDLAERGYDAEWQSIPAAAFGAPHIRERLFILAYANNDQQPTLRQHDEARGMPPTAGDVPNATSKRPRQLWGQQHPQSGQAKWDLYWATGESPVPRVADGIPNRVDRLRGLGNAVVPQVAQWIGERIMAASHDA